VDLAKREIPGDHGCQPPEGAELMDRYARELEELFSQSFDVDTPSGALAARVVGQKAPLVLYGAGTLGQFVLGRLRKAGVEPAAFADETPSKQGQSLEGVPILGLADAVARHGDNSVFAVTILNPHLRYLDAERRLRQCGARSVISFLHLARHLPDQFLPYLQFESPRHTIDKSRDIAAALRLFADDESRRQFVAHVRFRLQLAFEALPAADDGDYFSTEFLAPLPADTTFVDCGAYDGDSIRQFLRHRGEEFNEILAFEPDPENYQRLCSFVATLPAAVGRRITTYCMGVGARRERVAFSATGNMGASFDDAGNCMVETIALHEVVPVTRRSLFIKLDVEGAEQAALAGAGPLIQQGKPLLAVSVYHRPEDLWKIPSDLQAMNPGYRLFLRTLGHDGMDVICYAVPPERISRSFDASLRSMTA
jgi:FkbM family methyltransferase